MAKYLIERTVPGEYLNADGTTTTDKDAATLYTSVNDAFNKVQAITPSPRNDVGALVPVTESRTLGTPVS